jgi:hypothetical protein
MKIYKFTVDKFKFTFHNGCPKLKTKLVTPEVLEILHFVKNNGSKFDFHPESVMEHYLKTNPNCKFRPLKLKGYGLSSTADVYINTQSKVILKFDGSIVTEFTPKRAIPTLYTQLLFEDNHFDIRIQPVANVTQTVVRKAIKMFNQLDTDEIGEDLHYGNVGKYRNKFVVIDW